MPWVERFESSRPVERDAENHIRGARNFRVWGYSRTQIIADPTSILNDVGEPLPALGSEFESMTLDRYTTAPAGEVYDVDALYSNDGRFLSGGGSLGPTEAAPLWSGSNQTEVFKLPFARLRPTSAEVGGFPISIPGWELTEQPIRHTLRRITRNVLVDASVIGFAIAAMDAQHDRLHKIGGRWYRFESGPWQPDGRNKYRLNYLWISDPGTRVIDVANSSTIRFPQATEWNLAPGQWVRPPFHEVIAQPQINIEDDPEFTVFLPYAVDQTGWSTLPGMQE